MEQNIMQAPQLQITLNNYIKQSLQILKLSNAELISHLLSESESNPLIEDIKYDSSLSFDNFSSKYSAFEVAESTHHTTCSMYDYLMEQVNLLKLPEGLIRTIKYGIFSLDENGYLNEDEDIWAKHCNVTEETVKRALHIIQNLDPVGLGAADFKGSILIQMKNSGYPHELLETIVEEDLELIACNNISEISSKYDISSNYISELVNTLKSCHPKPGQLINNQSTQYIIPEASIRKKNYKWELNMHSWNAPIIQINQAYLKNQTIDQSTKNYLHTKYNQIKELNKSIKYRSNTLESVLVKILEVQSPFLENGWGAIKPLTLNQLAEELDLHTSTVSRAVSNKFIETPHGTIAISKLFQSGVRQKKGPSKSSRAIKEYIKTLVKTEDKSKPLSDEKIKMKIHELHDVNIARRTVMKYREQLNIASSSKRKYIESH